MPPNVANDPRLKLVEELLQDAASLDAMANNFQTRGKVALSETKTKDAELLNAAKMVAGLVKAGVAVNGSMKKLLSDYKMLKNTGDFGDFAAKLKRENETLGKTASLAKQFSTLLSERELHIALKQTSISYEGMLNYANQYVTLYVAFAKGFNKVSKFKTDSSGKADPALAKVQDGLLAGASAQGMCENMKTSGKVALNDLKKAKKETKDKAQQKDFDSMISAVETLIKSAGAASDEYGAMEKDYAEAKKSGDFAACAVKLKSRSAAFRTVQQHAADLAKKIDSAKFDAKSVTSHPKLQALMNYRKQFDIYLKEVKSALG
jgi:hypothetical protein